MEEIVKQITDKWKTLIESTIVDGYSRKVESINFFRNYFIIEGSIYITV